MSIYGDHKVVIGHFGFIPGDSLPSPSDYLHATVLRNPIDRVLSDYFYHINDVSEHNLSEIERKIKFMPMDEAFYAPEICTRFANYQAVHFASFFHFAPGSLSDEELLRLAKKGLDQYDLVGTTEKLSDFLEVFKRIFHFGGGPVLQHHNVTSARKEFSDLSVKLKTRIEAINQVDMELWRYAGWLFQHKTRYYQALCEKENPVVIKTASANMQPDAVLVNTESSSLEFLNASVSSKSRLNQDLLAGEEAVLSIDFRCLKDLNELTIGYAIFHNSGFHMFGVNTRLLGYRLKCKAEKEYHVDFNFTVNLGIGTYWVNVSAHTGLDHLTSCYFWKEHVAEFAVEGFLDASFEGLARLMPVCYIEDDLYAVSIVDQTAGFKCIGFNTPQLKEIVGRIKAVISVLQVQPSEQFSVVVEISNEGINDWISEGTRPINISYHWIDAGGDKVIFDGIRTPLPFRTVRAGSVIRVHALVEAPNQIGDFVLELSLVQESVCWFEERGFNTCKICVHIGPQNQE